MENLLLQFKEKYSKVIVTGGAGFIGSHICEELVKNGLEVISIDDYSAGKKKNLEFLIGYPNFSAINCDITDYESLEKCFPGVDVIFHNAASKKNICLVNPRRDLEVNAKGTFNLLELAIKYKIKKFVQASTGSVYGEAKYFPQDENHPLDPCSYYGVSKLAGEKYVMLFHKLFGLNASVLRYFHVYGPRQESNEFGGVVSIFIKNMINQKPSKIFGDGTQQRSFTYVKDIVKANILLAIDDRAIGQVYNCASGINVTINQLYDLMAKTFNHDHLNAVYEDWLIGDIKVFDVSNAKIKNLGFQFETDFALKLEETIQEMRNYLG